MTGGILAAYGGTFAGLIFAEYRIPKYLLNKECVSHNTTITFH